MKTECRCELVKQSQTLGSARVPLVLTGAARSVLQASVSPRARSVADRSVGCESSSSPGRSGECEVATPADLAEIMTEVARKGPRCSLKHPAFPRANHSLDRTGVQAVYHL